MPTLRVSLAQIDPVMGDFDGNLRLIGAQLDRARQIGADVVCFPELALCGYPPEDLLLRPAFLDANRAALETLAPRTAGLTVLVGLAWRGDDGAVRNAAAVLNDGRLAAVYAKRELPNYGVFDEMRYFQAGEVPLTLDLAGVRLGVSICEDIWVTDGAVERSLRGEPVDILLNLSASPFHAGKQRTRRQLLSGYARRCGVTLAYVNLVGGQDELVFDGDSVFVSPDGSVAASARRFSEDLLTLDLEVEESRGRGSAVRLQPRPELERPVLLRAPEPELGETEEVFQALVLGTRDYVRKNGFGQVVIGLSGGVDSALTAALAVSALGPEQVIGVTMPSTITSAETLSDAGATARALGTRLITIPIEPVFAAYREALAAVWGPGDPGLAHENLQARIRGTLLMALSNRYGWLVLTTGNKSETATGYCTLYGDMAGGFAVIKDVPKTLVYKLAEHVNRRAGRELIPQSVLRRPPTAELKPGQKDSDSLPPYPVLDPILQAYVEADQVPAAIAAAGFVPEVVREVARLVDRSEYKRRQAPPGVKITPKAFGRDRRLPITNRFQPPEVSPRP
jgi:NAD+ synthase (glutamine-hydrolysing)